MKHKLLLMCGIPGSGKSTMAKSIAEKGKFESVTYVSRDEVRFALLKGTKEYEAAFSNRETTDEEEIKYISNNYFSKEDEVYAEFVERIKNGLATSELTIADATHLNFGARVKLLRALGSSLKGCEVNIFVMNIPLETAIEQNELRKGTIAYVPPKSIKGMFNSLTMPSEDEGFDNIYFYIEQGAVHPM